MNEKILNELGAILEYLRKGIEAGGSFVQEQAPLVVQEAIRYGRAYETTMLLISLTLFGVGLRCQRNWKRIDWDSFENKPLLIQTILATVVGFISAVVAMNAWPDCLMAWFAPRIYLLHWIADLIHGAQPVR